MTMATDDRGPVIHGLEFQVSMNERSEGVCDAYVCCTVYRVELSLQGMERLTRYTFCVAHKPCMGTIRYRERTVECWKSVSAVMQVHLVEYDEETGVLNKMTFTHSSGEIW